MQTLAYTTDSKVPGSDAPGSDSPSGPRSWVVLGLLVAAAATFSYLGAYAVSGALVASDVLAAWPADADPRPRWMAWAFGGLLAAFLAVGGAVRYCSYRQLRRIDAMAEE